MYVLALCINRPAFMYARVAITFVRRRAAPVIEIILATSKYQHANRVTRYFCGGECIWTLTTRRQTLSSQMCQVCANFEARIGQRENSPKVDAYCRCNRGMMPLVDAQVRSEGGKAENRESENGRGVGWFQNDLAESNWTAQNWRWFKLAALSTCRLTHLRQHNRE